MLVRSAASASKIVLKMCAQHLELNHSQFRCRTDAGGLASDISHETTSFIFTNASSILSIVQLCIVAAAVLCAHTGMIPILNAVVVARAAPQRAMPVTQTSAMCHVHASAMALAPRTPVPPAAPLVFALQIAQVTNALCTVLPTLNTLPPVTTAAVAPVPRPAWKQHYVQARRWLASRCAFVWLLINMQQKHHAGTQAMAAGQWQVLQVLRCCLLRV